MAQSLKRRKTEAKTKKENVSRKSCNVRDRMLSCVDLLIQNIESCEKFTLNVILLDKLFACDDRLLNHFLHLNGFVCKYALPPASFSSLAFHRH